MADWKRTINVNEVASKYDDDSPETAEEAAHEIAALIRRQASDILDPDSPSYDFALEELVQDFELIEAQDEYDDPDYSAMANFNFHLKNLYDWADGNRIWLGAPQVNSPKP